MARKIMRWAPAFVLAAALPLAAQSTDAQGAASKEASTAAAHAGMALGAADLKMAHAHLQHVINCLVGPSGDGYDAQQADPCKGMGQGALADAEGDAARTSRLQAALVEAKRGVQATTVDQAHADAKKVMSSLQSK